MIRTVRKAKASEWSEIVSFTEEVDMWLLVKMVFDYTGWKWRNIYGRRATKDLMFRRGLIDLIAVHNGITMRDCARLTERSDHTIVINSLNKVEERLEHDWAARKYLKEVVAYLRDNYDLCKEKKVTMADFAD